MDDRTKGVGGERTSGRGDDSTIGRAEQPGSTRAYESPRTLDDDRGATVTSGEPVIRRTSTSGTSSADPRTHQIRADIERTRDDLSETIDAIQDRLRPSNIASNAASSVRQAASERMHDVAESDFVQDIRENPLPAIMIGIGVAGLLWLTMRDRDGHADSRRGRYRTRYERRPMSGYAAGYADEDDYRARGWRGESASGSSPGMTYREDTGSGLRGAEFDAERMASQAREYADDTRRAVRQTTRRAKNGLQRMLHENPLMVGAAAATIGAVIGMALPESERENQLMGEARDQVIENVQEMAHNAAERVQNAASEAAERVQDAASEATEHVKDVASESVGLKSDSSPSSNRT